MPITAPGAGALLATARRNAKAAIVATYTALAAQNPDGKLTSAQAAQAAVDAENADNQAILTFIAANAVVVVTGVTTGGGVSGPGTIT